MSQPLPPVLNETTRTGAHREARRGNTRRSRFPRFRILLILALAVPTAFAIGQARALYGDTEILRRLAASDSAPAPSRADAARAADDARVRIAELAGILLASICVLAVRASLRAGELFLRGDIRAADHPGDRNSRTVARLPDRYEELFDKIPVACLAYDDTGRITNWNYASELLFGKTAAEVGGKFLWEALSAPDRWDSARAEVAEVLRGASLEGMEWNYGADTPEPKMLVANVFPLRDAAGRVTGAISVNADVTARRQARAEQQRLLSDLAESEAHLQNITTRSHCLLWEAGVSVVAAWPGFDNEYFDQARGLCLAWDVEILHEEEVFRWLPVDRADGQPFSAAWRASISPTDRKETDRVATDALRRRDARYIQELPCRMADGTVRILLESVDITEIEPSRFYLVGVCTDITVQKAAEARLKAVALELERSNKSLQEFAFIASHDLKEPLRKIRTFGSLLSRRDTAVTPAESCLYLERMLGATERMQALIDGLLAYSLALRAPRTVGGVDLNDTLREVLADLATAVEESGVEIRVEKLPIIRGDSSQMHQLFQHLLGNALQFRKPGGKARITVRVEEETQSSAMARVSVVDNGVGFADKYSDRIFELFEQIGGSAIGGAGTGVGLAICRQIVDRHGGAISAVGKENEGAVFSVTLPLENGAPRPLGVGQ